jgi:hypothetical protein
MRQAEALARRSGRSLEDAKEAVSDTEAGRQLRALANGEHRHEKAKDWQASVFWGRAEERLCTASVRRFTRASWPNATLMAAREPGIEVGRKASRSERAGARMPSRKRR